MVLLIRARIIKIIDSKLINHTGFLPGPVIIIMEICQAPTLRLRALNKHNTHNVHQDGKCYEQFNESLHIMYTSTRVEA